MSEEEATCTRGWGDDECGAPAVFTFGVLRSCGCANTPVAFSCAHHLYHEPICRHCRAENSVALIEPVRLTSAAFGAIA